MKIPEELIEKYVAGEMVMKDIAQLMGRNSSTVYKALQEAGIDTSARSKNKKIDRDRAIIEKWKEVKNATIVAELFKISHQRVHQILNREKIHRPNKRFRRDYAHVPKVIPSEYLEKARNGEMNHVEIAKAMGISSTTVRRLLNAAGVFFERKWNEEKIIVTIDEMRMILGRFPIAADCSNSLRHAVQKHGGFRHFRSIMEK